MGQESAWSGIPSPSESCEIGIAITQIPSIRTVPVGQVGSGETGLSYGFKILKVPVYALTTEYVLEQESSRNCVFWHSPITT